MFQKKQIKETVTKEVISKYYSLSEIKELVKKDAEAQGYKATKLLGLPGGGMNVEAKEIPGFNMPKSVEELNPSAVTESKVVEMKPKPKTNKSSRKKGKK